MPILMPILTIRQLIDTLTLHPDGSKRGTNFIHVVAKSSASSVRKNGVFGGIDISEGYGIEGGKIGPAEKSQGEVTYGKINGVAVVNPHYKKLVHFYGISAMTGHKYQKRLDKVRTQAGEELRTAEAPTNGHEKIAPQIVRQKNGNLGLACEVLNWLPNECRYENTETGKTVSKDELAPFLREKDTDVDYITPNLNNIVSITIDGTTYTIDDSDYTEMVETLTDVPPLYEQLAAV